MQQEIREAKPLFLRSQVTIVERYSILDKQIAGQDNDS